MSLETLKPKVAALIEKAQNAGGDVAEEIITITTAITNTLEAYNTFSAFINDGENIVAFVNIKNYDEITLNNLGIYAVIEKRFINQSYCRNRNTNRIVTNSSETYDYVVPVGETYKKVVLF